MSGHLLQPPVKPLTQVMMVEAKFHTREGSYTEVIAVLKAQGWEVAPLQSSPEFTVMKHPQLQGVDQYVYHQQVPTVLVTGD